MKSFALKLIVAALAIGVGFASAQTFWVNGVLFGNVCRNGVYYTVYPIANAQPVGSVCPIRDGYGNVVGTGIVSNE